MSEGFIHCSFENQLEEVFERYYADQDFVVLLEIDPVRLTAELKVEPSTNDEPYPHIYGPVNREAVVHVHKRLIEFRNKPANGQASPTSTISKIA